MGEQENPAPCHSEHSRGPQCSVQSLREERHEECAKSADAITIDGLSYPAWLITEHAELMRWPINVELDYAARELLGQDVYRVVRHYGELGVRRAICEVFDLPLPTMHAR